MTSTPKRSPSRLLEYLPAIYQESPFLGQFLLAFEKVLLGREDDVDYCYKDGELVSHEDDPDICYKGLEETIAGLAALFDPKETPEEFLSWLAGWAAFSLRADLDPAQQIDFVAKIIQLYRWRGTKKNLQDLLEIFTVGIPAVIEAEATEFQIGVHSTIGKDTYLGGVPPHFFRVIISLPRAAPEVQARQMEIARGLIELEKPAHTHYALEVKFPSMQIGVFSKVGVDTILGTIPET